MKLGVSRPFSLRISLQLTGRGVPLGCFAAIPQVNFEAACAALLTDLEVIDVHMFSRTQSTGAILQALFQLASIVALRQ